MTDELKPCPFCGSEEVRIAVTQSPRWYYGECEECSARTDFYLSQAEAIEAWNTRVQTVFGMTLDEVRQMMKRDAERGRTCKRVEPSRPYIPYPPFAPGYEIKSMVCSECHEAMMPWAIYCECCGARVVSDGD